MLSKETLQFILQHRFDDISRLALSARSKISLNVNIPLAISQISGRQAVKAKIPSWYENDEIIYPRQLSLEQCSSEITACYKSSLLSGNSFVDLTGGFGVDCAFISKQFQTATYVEQQPELCEIAKHNFSALHLDQITIINENAASYLEKMQPANCIFLDPARRDNSGKKTVAISDCEPNVGELKNLLLEKSNTTLIKLSPMLDISLALKELPNTCQVHIVSVENECKELLFLMKKDWNSEPLIVCTNIRKSKEPSIFSFLRSEEKNAGINYTSEVKEFLYEPNTSLLKGGAYKLTAIHYKLQKLHPDSHLYTSSEWIPDFPGRSFRVRNISSFTKNELKSALQNISQANLSIRNFPMSVNELRKKLKLSEGGENYLFATTLGNGNKVLIICAPSISYQSKLL